LSDFASDGIAKAVERRTENFEDLVSGRTGTDFRLSLNESAASVRYDAVFRFDTASDRIAIKPQVARHVTGVNVQEGIETDHYSFLPGTLGPMSAWLGELLRDDIKWVDLDPALIRKPSPPGSAGDKRITGAGLARMIANLRSKHPERFRDWVSHVRTSMPEIEDIDSIPRPWENTRCVMVRYAGGTQVPSWMVSEGTLRLLQLTILAYLPDFHGVYLIEEPENGVHPSALETIYESLSSMYDAQVLVSSHSPILLNMAEPKQLLCFSKSDDGVKIVRGDQHPALLDWHNEVSLGTLAASGILG
jgi:hypothetical protein